MKRIIGLAMAATAMMATIAVAAPKTGAPAPAFTVAASDGKTYSLSDFKGKPVILEWTNDQCPFVVKHYATGNMQASQKAAKEDGAVWLTVISSAPGKQGHVSPEAANKLTADRNAVPTAVLLDESGVVGQAYAAKTTPHMYLIDEAGILRYQGGMDDKPTTKHDDVKTAKNYILAALTEWKASGTVTDAETKPYGCSIKYPD